MPLVARRAKWGLRWFDGRLCRDAPEPTRASILRQGFGWHAIYAVSRESFSWISVIFHGLSVRKQSTAVLKSDALIGIEKKWL